MNKSDLRPIFIIGCCNSGTSLVHELLLGQKEISGPSVEGQDLPELPIYLKHFLGRQTFRLFAHPKFGHAYRLTERDCTDQKRREITRVYGQHHKSGTRFVEKSPANSVRMRFLQSVFPDAQFLVIVRHGIAVAEGIRRKRRHDPIRPHLSGQNTEVEDAALQWFHANKIIIKDLEHIGSYKLFKYEEFVSLDRESLLRSIAKFLGVAKITDGSLPSLRQDDNETQISRFSRDEYKTVFDIQHELLQFYGYI